MAYPIYLTIGNIPKDIHRKPSCHVQILIGYLPTTKLEGFGNKSAQWCALVNLFHTCMERVLGPISHYGETGVPMVGGDGVWRRCHPILANFVGDYPEQVLVTCTYYGRCPKCLVPPDQLGEYDFYPPRDHNEAVETYLLADGDVRAFHAACRDIGLKPAFHLFWESFPLVNIFLSITPDILHQLLQGVMKHLISWLTSPSAFGPTQIDARCRLIPPNHHIKLFSKGITTLSRISGKEFKAICGILLALIVDLPLPHRQLPTRALKAAHALLDFLFLAQFQSHTSETVHRLEDSLVRFHENKAIFAELGIREHFNLPKVHSLVHYASSITLFGTTDNYNTEQTERLHIDFTKDAYRATNRKDEISQMTIWLDHHEKMQRHSAFINRQQGHSQPIPSPIPIGPPRPGARHLKMAMHPSVKALALRKVVRDYGAKYFPDALADFVARINNPGASRNEIKSIAANTLLPFSTVAVFHKIKFTSRHDSDSSEVIDTIHIRPEQTDMHGWIVPARSDTVLVRGQDQDTVHGKDGKF